jgi:hypothetical protein
LSAIPAVNTSTFGNTNFLENNAPFCVSSGLFFHYEFTFYRGLSFSNPIIIASMAAQLPFVSNSSDVLTYFALPTTCNVTFDSVRWANIARTNNSRPINCFFSQGDTVAYKLTTFEKFYSNDPSLQSTSSSLGIVASMASFLNKFHVLYVAIFIWLIVLL